jgi:hypothetical protein
LREAFDPDSPVHTLNEVRQALLAAIRLQAVEIYSARSSGSVYTELGCLIQFANPDILNAVSSFASQIRQNFVPVAEGSRTYLIDIYLGYLQVTTCRLSSSSSLSLFFAALALILTLLVHSGSKEAKPAQYKISLLLSASFQPAGGSIAAGLLPDR